MTIIVDFHVHVFPDHLQKWMKKVPLPKAVESLPSQIDQVKRHIRSWLKPVISSMHGLQTQMRYLPDPARRNMDQLGAVFPLSGLFVESTVSDLHEAMEEAMIQYAMVVAHPPFIPNEFVLELYSEHPQLIPVVNIPKGASQPGQMLREYAEKGAKALKIHAASDGEGVDSSRYRALLKVASDLGLPVILHTGYIHNSLFRDPHQGLAENFKKWYKSYPQTQFILAHMNFHEPNAALDLCEEFENLWVDTSWQPSEVIGEAARRIGAERVLFSTDWPLVGNNMTVGRRRVQDCIETGLLNEKQARLILGENALKLLGLNPDAH